MAEMYCNIFGIDSIGNIIPESIMTGIINNIADMRRATICVSAIVDTRIPNDSANRM